MWWNDLSEFMRLFFQPPPTQEEVLYNEFINAKKAMNEAAGKSYRNMAL